MRMRSERSKSLHNFMLPCLKWGNQKHLRCMKVNSNGVQVSGVNRQSHSSRSEESTESRSLESGSEMRMFFKDLEMRPKVSKSIIKKTDDVGIEAVREKLMFDLKTAADKMKEAILSKEAVVAEEEAEEKNDSAGMEETPAAVALSMAETRPWNLRTRRAACKAPNVDGGGSKNLKLDEKKSNSNSPLRSDGGAKSPRLKIGTEKKKKKVKLVVPLSKREIDEDFMEMVGLRPPRRPKKRTRIVQKQLDTLFPGLWLSEITADLYKVPELPENGKVMKV
ncbi:uncharacterized protein LOC111807980 [Cucurbita pepo subsp. pepo]|uniref:uncharacterized protein LOC111807980 n=1 Tax=Cucurbita pepo subsp. pepo TaxID=3664 RepID=UPI000C9D5BDE|nr:uncharacterized protein LOC111807980 [Cucurbita pepo subsp. pepo]